MRSSLSGPATTLLMLIPLVVIPLLAVFGVPEVSFKSAGEGATVSVDSGPDGELSNDMFVPIQEQDPAAGAATTPAPAAKPTQEDPFAMLGDPAAASASAQATVDSRNAGLPQANAAIDVASDRRPRPDAAVEAANAGGSQLQSPFTQMQDEATVEGPDTTSASVTLESAVQRLRELGIRTYQLSPGESAEAFHFSCCLTSADNPRIVRRFEAEAGEPLQAVVDVLGQVENWARTQ